MKFLLSRLAAAAVAAVLGLVLGLVVVSAAAAESSSDLEVGQRVCVEGYVMDYYCIERGRLLDNNSVKTLEQPGLHSVHCLVDVERCYESPFEILVDPPRPNVDGGEGGEQQQQLYYKRGCRMTQETQDKTIQVARSVGICSTCNNSNNGGGSSINRGFRAAFDAIIVDLGSNDDDIPKTIEATQIKNSNEIENPCQELFGMPNILDGFVDGDDDFAAVTPGDTDGGTLRPVISAHGALMMIGWGLLLFL